MAFTSVLVRMYINYVLRCLLDIDLTLEDEKKLIDTVYTYGSDLIYKFFWETKYCFFYEFFRLFLNEYRTGYCFSISKIKHRPY